MERACRRHRDITERVVRRQQARQSDRRLKSWGAVALECVADIVERIAQGRALGRYRCNDGKGNERSNK